MQTTPVTERTRKMTLKTSLPVLLAALLLSAPLASHAGTRDPGVNQRQHHQQHRIQQGVRSGELTAREAHRARNQQRAIRAEERAYKADGVLTRDERRDLHQDLNAASRSIYTEKHDGEKRGGN